MTDTPQWIPAHDHKMRLVFLVDGCNHVILDAVRPNGPRRCPECVWNEFDGCQGHPDLGTCQRCRPRRWWLLHRAPDVVDVDLPEPVAADA